GEREGFERVPSLLAHAAERISSQALEILRRGGEGRHIARAVALLDEPRNGAREIVESLLQGLDTDRADEAAWQIILSAAPAPAQLAWAIDQAAEAFPFEQEEVVLSKLIAGVAKQPLVVRCALVRLAARWPLSGRKTFLRE